MATRQHIACIRAARSGKSGSQLALGKSYLFGEPGLPANAASALYWLHRAACNQEEEACLLIGRHVPYEVAAAIPDPQRVVVWYERAFHAGIPQAGLVWAKLMSQNGGPETGSQAHAKVLRALEAAASDGIPEAQWLLAKELKRARDAVASAHTPATSGAVPKDAPLKWAVHAASNGVQAAQYALAEYAWSVKDHAAFLKWALPAAHARADFLRTSRFMSAMSEQDGKLFSRCAEALAESDRFDGSELERLLDLAGPYATRDAQFALGLWHANLDAHGERVTHAPHKSNYKKAIHWLELAGRQGLPQAWHALFKIYTRPNTGLVNVCRQEVERCLERAAEGGLASAQAELGERCWRARRKEASHDVRAVYWLQRAASQGHESARALLDKIAEPPQPAQWATAAQRVLTTEVAMSHPLLAARIELAGRFGLSLKEALLLDVSAADCGHCLLIDMHAQNLRSRRRLILIRTGEERQALTRIARRFATVDPGAEGPEGSYRKRLYLFRKLFPGIDTDGSVKIDSPLREQAHAAGRAVESLPLAA